MYTTLYMAWKDKKKQNEYWDKVKNKYNSRHRERYKKDPEFRKFVLERARKWREKNKKRIQDNLYTPKKRFEILERDKFTCRYCGKKAPDVVLEVDHIIPVSKGGTNAKTNLITSCRKCNQGKGYKIINTK